LRCTKGIGIFRTGFIRRNRSLWIIIGIYAAILVITGIVVPTTIVLKRKNNVSTTATAAMKTTTTKTTDVPLTTKKSE
jgi:flagellar basal body-associated protein FliL